MSVIDELRAFLDACNVPPGDTLIDRVREFYNGCNDTLRRYQDRLGELPYITDPRENPFIAGWGCALMHVVEGAAGVPDSRDPTGRARALFAFRRWADEEDRQKGLK